MGSVSRVDVWVDGKGEDREKEKEKEKEGKKISPHKRDQQKALALKSAS